MVRPAIRRTLFAVVAVLVVPLGLAAPAQAARTPRASVTITSPVAGSAGDGQNLTISGTAKGVTRVDVTIGNDVNVYEASVTRSGWSTSVNDQPAGPTRICASAVSSGVVLATSCVDYTVVVDPQYFSVAFPDDGQTVESTFTAGGGCHGGSSVRIALDGVAETLPCEEFQWYRTYTDVPGGSHTLVAEQLALDGSVLVTRTRTFTTNEIPVATVAITSPEDGAVDDDRSLSVAGTQTSNVDAYVGLRVDGAFASATTASDGQWTDTLSLDWGTHEICAFVTDRLGRDLDSDCVTHTVALQDDSLAISTPTEGSAQQPYPLITGTCLEDFVVTVEGDGDSRSVRCLDGAWITTLALSEGPQTVTATMDAGAGGTASRTVSFVVDATPPDQPVVTSPSASTTLTSTPVTLVGTGEPGSDVVVYGTDGEPYRTVTVDASGRWSAVLDRDWFATAGVLTGRRATVRFSIFSSDAAGNQSATEAVYQTRLR